MGVRIVQAVLDWLRDHRIILPAPNRLERLARAGRALARRRAAGALLALLTEDQLKAIDALLVNDSTLKRTLLALSLRVWELAHQCRSGKTGFRLPPPSSSTPAQTPSTDIQLI
jgi:hypothetical protein